MAIPVYMQGFKSAGIYRVVFDRSQILNQDISTLRLVVGWSPKGYFNTPTYITNVGKFHEIFGYGSKTLEKRGCYFHRMCEQALAAGPILALNLKRFANEKVGAASIDTNFNVKNPIDTVQIPVEDIYDTTRFWTLSSEKLNEMRGAEYINIATTNTKATSGTFFIRKASGSKVQAYNITVSDWYKSTNEDIPEFLQGYENNLMSDFMAEVYVFNGRFIVDQVLSSDTLKKYFMLDKDKGKLKLRQYVVDGFGDYVDTLDALYEDETSGALGHYVGSLIPYFQDKNGNYAALDIVFNQDLDVHNMMMSFNTDMLDEDGIANIDLSGSRFISTSENGNAHEKHPLANDNKSYGASVICVEDIFKGVAKTNLLGNSNSPVVADRIMFHSSVYNDEGKVRNELLYKGQKKITGSLYVSDFTAPTSEKADGLIILNQIGNNTDIITIEVPAGADFNYVLYQLGAAYKTTDKNGEPTYASYKDWKFKDIENISGNGLGTYFHGEAYKDRNSLEGPKSIITSINRDLDSDKDDLIKLSGSIIKCNIESVYVTTSQEYCSSVPENKDAYTGVLLDSNDPTESWTVYNSSVSFIPYDDENWKLYEDKMKDSDAAEDAKHTYSIYCPANANSSLISVISKGDRFLAVDGKVDMDNDGDYDDEVRDGFHDLVYVQDVETKYDKDGVPVYHVIKFTGKVSIFDGEVKDDGSANITENVTNPESGMPNYAEAMVFGGPTPVKAKYLVRIDRALNQEIGDMFPVYLEGYTYENSKPNGTNMMARLEWQNFMLDALNEYKGLRTGLLNKSEIDYRYVVDTWESYVDTSIKSQLSMLCKEKENAFCIANFPSVRTFVKCPYTSFTDDKGVFNVQYVVDGKNKKKAAVKGFGLPSNDEGASFIAFYTPLKFSDGYIDSIIPSAALVSNLFMEKYRSRQPYYIVAGPNYGAISASGLVGPDYHYSREELNIIEPYGVNCMVYRPKFNTFINANQTAKQTPKSALSSINVRELVIYIMDEVERILQAYQWEFNNPQVRTQIKDRVDVICSRVQSNGGIQDFLNVMDESNNGPDIIDNEMAVLSTHIEPGRGMGKLVHELSIYRTGAMRSSIISE